MINDLKIAILKRFQRLKEAFNFEAFGAWAANGYFLFIYNISAGIGMVRNWPWFKKAAVVFFNFVKIIYF